MNLLLSLLLLLALSLPLTFAKKPSKHPHTGILSPKIPGPFPVELGAADLKELASGNSVMKQIEDPSGLKTGLCVQDISSPSTDVWSQILSFNSYVGKVSKLKTCETYETKDEGEFKRIKVKMVIGVLPGYSYTCFYDHKYYKDKNSLTWSLDYEEYSDFDDVQGHWHVEDLEERRCRVFYAADLKMRGKVPGPVMNILSKKALREATGWVKRESEKATKARREGPAIPGGALPQQ
ncbi:hypothetical protein TrLO_g4252 [Triparma laevis f. longispina]|uniref:Coenzyme Q-binding protein COQ10 START domain-containing protein n=1 Tax=Triparma laevis f. longispina TaxID=1714387 RepID=A0A9W6Z7C6_9STRA|nr:hypothetical protein TrLO_g4252 [Triparma laevis f. longispina]